VIVFERYAERLDQLLRLAQVFFTQHVRRLGD
jgi:hypothetical protein